VRRRACYLHGGRLSWLEAGEPGNPPILLIHGIATSAETWSGVIDSLGAEHHVIAVDLPGHGQSDASEGDFSLGAQASVLRDVLAYLRIPAVTVVGHSLGGGIAMQFTYQFPERVQRLVLVSSGGLGPAVSPLLRAAALPGANVALTVAGPVLSQLGPLSRAMKGRLRPTIIEGLEVAASLGQTASRRTFLSTLTTVIDTSGQRISGTSKLYLAQEIPTLFIAGARDAIIPVKHSRAAHELLPDSRLVVLPDSGHSPQLDDPDAVSAAIADFIATAEPADNDPDHWAEILTSRSAATAASTDG
jgi:pimeloyl-ACP methyl ester carboxylesterase